MVDIIHSWDDNVVKIIKQQLKSKQYKYPLFLKKLAVRRQFWFANIWMSVFTEQFTKTYPTNNLNGFFKFADKAIASLPDLFNDELYMLAHGLLWENGFKIFYINIHHTVHLMQKVSQKLSTEI